MAASEGYEYLMTDAANRNSQEFTGPTQVFSREYCEIFKNTFFEEHLGMAASVMIKTGKTKTEVKCFGILAFEILETVKSTDPKLIFHGKNYSLN